MSKLEYIIASTVLLIAAIIKNENGIDIAIIMYLWIWAVNLIDYHQEKKGVKYE